MNELFLLSEAQMRRIEPSYGVPRVHDRRIVSALSSTG